MSGSRKEIPDIFYEIVFAYCFTIECTQHTKRAHEYAIILKESIRFRANK